MQNNNEHKPLALPELDKLREEKRARDQRVLNLFSVGWLLFCVVTAGYNWLNDHPIHHVVPFCLLGLVGFVLMMHYGREEGE